MLRRSKLHHIAAAATAILQPDFSKLKVVGLHLPPEIRNAGRAKIGELKDMNIQKVRVQRVSFVTTERFDTAVAQIDTAIGHPNMAEFGKSFSTAKNQAEMQKVVDPVTEPNGLMEFMR